VPEYALIRLPRGLAVEDASLVEPASVAWHGVRRAALVPGERLAVVGAGSIGSMASVIPHPGLGPYVTAKHAVLGFSDSLRRLEYQPRTPHPRPRPKIANARWGYSCFRSGELVLDLCCGR